VSSDVGSKLPVPHNFSWGNALGAENSLSRGVGLALTGSAESVVEMLNLKLLTRSEDGYAT
jgi:hypothetical protein